MSDKAPRSDLDLKGIDISRLDLSRLVGKYVRLFSKQFPGKVLRAKVLSTSEHQILVNSGTDNDMLNTLVNRQTIIIQFPYKGQDVSINAQLNRSDGGRSYFVFEERAVPLSQRKFVRVNAHRSVKMAAFPVLTFNRKSLTKLRWLETDTINVSSGGLLIGMSGPMERDARLLMNVEMHDELFPQLVVGQVRHSFQSEETSFRVGIEFVVREMLGSAFPQNMIEQLPPVVQSYTGVNREKLNKKILAGSIQTEPVP